MMLGIDLGGTKIAYAVVTPGTATILARHVTETRSHDGPTAVMERMIADCRYVCAAAGISPAALTGIGIGVPGVFDDTTGCTLFCPICTVPGRMYLWYKHSLTHWDVRFGSSMTPVRLSWPRLCMEQVVVPTTSSDSRWGRVSVVVW